MLSEFFNFSFNPLSIIFISLIVLLFIALALATLSQKVRNTLIRVKILEKEEKPQSFLIWLIAVMLIVRSMQVFLIQPFIVDGGSMLPTFESNDMILIDKVSYKLEDPQRGDVIVFKFHQDGNELDGKYFIKRLIGLPGDRILINGTSTIVYTKTGGRMELNENYVEESRQTDMNIDVTLKTDEYFVMGDNRIGSYDSRSWGPIHESQIAGRAVVRILPHTALFPGKAEYSK